MNNKKKQNKQRQTFWDWFLVLNEFLTILWFILFYFILFASVNFTKIKEVWHYFSCFKYWKYPQSPWPAKVAMLLRYVAHSHSVKEKDHYFSQKLVPALGAWNYTWRCNLEATDYVEITFDLNMELFESYNKTSNML